MLSHIRSPVSFPQSLRFFSLSTTGLKSCHQPSDLHAGDLVTVHAAMSPFIEPPDSFGLGVWVDVRAAYLTNPAPLGPRPSRSGVKPKLTR